MIIKKIKQYNLLELLTSEGFEAITNTAGKNALKDEANKDQINTSQSNLNTSNLNLEKFKRFSAAQESK